ncbi:MAG: hypothetical protein ACFE9L_03720 [Candidatus Hodarchaeota archaeon]
MSNWQSFFNQLSRPVNNEISHQSNEICHCTKGTLFYHRYKDGNNSYNPQGKCSVSSVCFAIQTDKHRVRTYNTPLIKGPEVHSFEKRQTQVLSFKFLINEKTER